MYSCKSMWVRRQKCAKTGPRLVATLLLASVCALTCAPACGSPMDVDAVGCCQHHGCIPSGINKGERPASNKLAGRHACCPERHQELSTTTRAEDCCNRGRLTYPAAQVQAPCSTAAFSGGIQSALDKPIDVVLAAGGGSALGPYHGLPPPEIRAVPFYTLNSSLRI